MKRLYLLAGLHLLAVECLWAGNDNYLTGARPGGMGFCGLTLSDLWGAQHNQANLAFLDHYSAGVYYENKFNLKETALKSFAAAIPAGKTGGFGVTATQFGSTNYTEGKYGVGYAHKLAEHFSAGLQLNYNCIRLGDIYGKKQAFTAEFGIRARLIEPLTLGAHIYNVSRTQLNQYANEYIPTVLRIGLEYRFSKAVFLLTETSTTIRYKTNIKAGIEYNLKEKVYFRAGINTCPFLSSFGIGYRQKILHLDIAAAYHQVLGFSPNVSLHLSFGQKNKTADVGH
jgi:hypothetical protein